MTPDQQQARRDAQARNRYFVITLARITGAALALCLAHHGLAHRFITLQTADRHPSKPHPSMAQRAMYEAGASPETTIMIGDTSFDMAMAVAAGSHALGVAWGYHPPEELILAGASRVAATPASLPGHLEDYLA